MPRKPAPLKSLSRHYSAAIVRYCDLSGMDIEKTRTGKLSSYSMGWLNGSSDLFPEFEKLNPKETWELLMMEHESIDGFSLVYSILGDERLGEDSYSRVDRDMHLSGKQEWLVLENELKGKLTTSEPEPEPTQLDDLDESDLSYDALVESEVENDTEIEIDDHPHNVDFSSDEVGSVTLFEDSEDSEPNPDSFSLSQFPHGFTCWEVDPKQYGNNSYLDGDRCRRNIDTHRPIVSSLRDRNKAAFGW